MQKANGPESWPINPLFLFFRHLPLTFYTKHDGERTENYQGSRAHEARGGKLLDNFFCYGGENARMLDGESSLTN